MAQDTGFYSPFQFDVAYKAETTLGTANVTTMLEVNIDDWPSVDFGVERFLGQRHGEGRTPKKEDIYVNSQGKQKGINIAGLYDSTIGADMLENVIGEVVGSSPASFDIPYNYTGPEVKHGDTDSDNTGAFTLALISPEGSNTYILPGCVLNRYKLIATGSEDGGRFHHEMDFVSRHNWSVEQAAPGSRTAYGAVTGHKTLYDLRSGSSVEQVGGVDVSIYKLEVEIISNVKFVGFGTSGIPDQIARAVPGYEVNIVVGMKYDANSDGLSAKQLNENDIIVALHNAAWASATFGMLANYCQISEDFDMSNVEDGAFFDVPMKAFATTSGDVIQIVP